MNTDVKAQLAKLRGQKEESVEGKPSDFEKSAYVNTVIFSGRLSKEPEYQIVGANKKEIAKAALAVFNPAGGDEAKMMFFDLCMWLQEETTENHPANGEEFVHFLEMKKGDSVVVEGRLSMRLYKEKPYYTITLSNISI